MPRRKWLSKQHPWWNENLTRLKREVLRLRGFYEDEHRPEIGGMRREAYVKKKDAFQKKARLACRSSWRDLVSNIGNRGPWGVVYKTMTNKLRTETVLRTVKDDQDTPTISMAGGAELFMRAFVPSLNQLMTRASSLGKRYGT